MVPKLNKIDNQLKISINNYFAHMQLYLDIYVRITSLLYAIRRRPSRITNSNGTIPG